MLRYYPGQDVLDVHRGKMTPRRLAVLINGLPPTSATRYAIEHPNDDGDRRWDDVTHLLNHVANLLQHQLRVSWAAGQLKGKPPNLPPLLPPEEHRDNAARVARRQRQLAHLEQFKAGTRRATPAQGPATGKRSLASVKDSGARPARPATPELLAALRARGERGRQ